MRRKRPTTQKASLALRQVDLQPHAAREAFPDEQQIPTAGGLRNAKVGGSDAELVEFLTNAPLGGAGLGLREARVRPIGPVDHMAAKQHNAGRLGRLVRLRPVRGLQLPLGAVDDFRRRPDQLGTEPEIPQEVQGLAGGIQVEKFAIIDRQRRRLVIMVAHGVLVALQQRDFSTRDQGPIILLIGELAAHRPEHALGDNVQIELALAAGDILPQPAERQGIDARIIVGGVGLEGLDMGLRRLGQSRGGQLGGAASIALAQRMGVPQTPPLVFPGASQEAERLAVAVLLGQGLQRDPTSSWQLRELDRALARLPDEQREVVLLVGLEGVAYDSAAQILGVPIGTVRSRLSRGRETLRGLMERQEEPTPPSAAASKNTVPTQAWGASRREAA